MQSEIRSVGLVVRRAMEAADSNTTLTLSQMKHPVHKEEDLKNLCKYWAKFLQFPEITTHEVRVISETIEQLLTQLDEFNASTETIKLNVENTLSLVPRLVDHSVQLHRCFQVIEMLELFLRQVEEAVSKLEAQVAQEEHNSSHWTFNVSKMKGMFSILSLPGLKKSNVQLDPVDNEPEKTTEVACPPEVQVMGVVAALERLRAQCAEANA